MANKVTAAKPKVGGAVYVANPSNSLTLPTDATTALAAAFKALGYISDDGLTNSPTLDSDTVKAWGGDEVLTVYQGMEDQFSFTLLEALSVDVLKQVYGATNVSGDLATGITINVKSNIELPEQVYVVEMVLKDGTLKRIVIPSARITDIGDITYSDSDAVGYDITIKAMPDSSTSITHYEYIKAATGATGATS